MASETVDPIEWSHPTPSWVLPHELQVLQCVNAGYKSLDLLQQPGLEHASTGMPGESNTGADTQDMKKRTYIRRAVGLLLF